MNVRKIILLREETLAEAGEPLARPVHRAVGLAVVENPFAGRFVEDLSPLFEVGREVGELLMTRVVALLGGAAVSYGKGAIVGTLGELEHGAAVLHPTLGRPMRAAVGGGEAIIVSNAKVASAGTSIDIPLGNKDNVWSFDEIDTVTVAVPDAPRPNEIVVAVVVADGGRPRARVGKGRSPAKTPVGS